MNIFEVVAMNKKLHEEHITSALGWFLDPRQSHGCGGLFLNKLLKETLEEKDYENWKIPDGSYTLNKGRSGKNNFNVELTIERDFDVDNSRVVVDIIIVIEKDNKKLVVGIENKILSGSVTRGQLRRQMEAILSDEKFDETRDKLAYIYLTPEGQSAHKEFQDFFKSLDKDSKDKLIVSKHLKWVGLSEKLFVSSLKDDNEGKIIPMVYETKFILKSFIQFISNDFLLPKPNNSSVLGIDEKCKGLEELFKYWKDKESPDSFFVGFMKKDYDALESKDLDRLKGRNYKILHDVSGANKGNWHEVKDFFEKMKKLNWKEPRACKSFCVNSLPKTSQASYLETQS